MRLMVLRLVPEREELDNNPPRGHRHVRVTFNGHVHQVFENWIDTNGTMEENVARPFFPP